MTTAHQKSPRVLSACPAARKYPLVIANGEIGFKLPKASSETQRILQDVLSAKLTPRQEIQDVCKKILRAPIHRRWGYQDLLLKAGLGLVPWGKNPRLIVFYPARFQIMFPQLAHVLPLLETFADVHALIGKHGRA